MSVNKFVTSMLLFNQRKKEWWEPFFLFLFSYLSQIELSAADRPANFRLLVRDQIRNLLKE